jgi:hypothetical protein
MRVIQAGKTTVLGVSALFDIHNSLDESLLEDIVGKFRIFNRMKNVRIDAIFVTFNQKRQMPHYTHRHTAKTNCSSLLSFKSLITNIF